MDLSVIIVNYDVYDDVCKCLNSINESVHNLEFEIIVSDNNSSDRRIEDITKLFRNVHLLNLSENFGFGAANNKAVEFAKGKYILFVNPDIVFPKETIRSLLHFLETHPNAGCAAPLIKRSNETIQYYYTFFPSVYSRLMQEFGLYTRARKMKYRMFNYLDQKILEGVPFVVDWALGACIMIPKSLFNELHGFDEAYFLYEEEVDLLLRMKALGYSTYILPSVNVIHNHNTSTAQLGFAFIRYHGFRSIIIFSIRHDKGIKRILNGLLLLFGTIFRYIRGTLFTKYMVGSFKTHTILYWDLTILNLKSNRYDGSLNFDFTYFSRFISAT